MGGADPATMVLALIGASTAPVLADDEQAACTGFLVPPAVQLLSRPAPESQTLPRRPDWIVGLPDPGYVFGGLNKVKIDPSPQLEKSAGCYPKDFTTEGAYIRLWIEPQELRGTKAWVRLSDLVAFHYQLPSRWFASPGHREELLHHSRRSPSCNRRRRLDAICRLPPDGELRHPGSPRGRAHPGIRDL